MASNGSSKSQQRPINRGSFKEVSGFDLFYQLTYMSAVAAAGITRSRIFQLGAQLPRIPADYFARTQLLSQKLGYDYASACTMVGLNVKSEVMKSLLLRLGNALTSGQPESHFLTEEAYLQGQTYEKEYERDLAALTKWTDAYAAMNISAALIVIVNLTSTMIYDINNAVLIGLILTAVLTASIGAWTLSKAAPQEVRDLFSLDGPPAQRLACQLSRVLPLAALIICLPLALVGIHLALLSLLAGLILLPFGLASILAGRQIGRMDREIGPFLRSLGSMAMSTGTTTAEALTRLDLSSYPALETDLQKLQWRLKAALDPELCWRKFALETGSKLIGEVVQVYNDAVKLGGDPDTVALLAAEFATKTIMLRAKRKVIASSFTWLTVVMHGAIAALMLFLLEIIIRFVNLLNSAAAEGSSSIPLSSLALQSFSAEQMIFFRWTTVGMVLLLVAVNAFAINATDGGHRYKMAFYAAILLLLSGLSMIAMPALADKILQP